MKKIFLFLLSIFVFFSAISYAETYDKAFSIKIDGVITGYTHKYISLALDKTEKNNGVLIIKLDTPGGLLGATRSIVQTILESDTPVITYVSPQGARAGSAGSFIVLASHYAAMSEGSNIGAAHPVSFTGKDIKGDMAEKVVNDTVAFIKSIAEKRNRNAEVAAKMVTESLSLTASQALEENIVDSVVNSKEQLLKKAAGKLNISENVKIEQLKPTTLQKTAFFLSDPNVLVLLLMIGVFAIILEFKLPGTFIFAGVGAVAIILFLFGINIIPINFLSLLLVFTGFGLLIAEMFIPSFGLLTLASIVSMVFGLYLMFDRQGNMGIHVSVWLILSLVIAVVAVVAVIGRLIMKDFKRKPAAGMDNLVGMKGRVMAFENGKGKVFVNGEIWNFLANEELEENNEVVVTDYDNMTLIAKKADKGGNVG